MQPHSLSRLYPLCCLSCIVTRNSATVMQKPFCRGPAVQLQSDFPGFTPAEDAALYSGTRAAAYNSLTPESLRWFIFQHEGPAGLCLFLACFY